MSKAPTPVDKHGRPVAVGSRVRLVQLPQSLLNDLPADEVAALRSMLGEVFEVTEIDAYGKPWIGKGWSDPDKGEYKGHSLALEPSEMELVDAHAL
jgi:hypothetical protein